ncbi:hypothetical protein PLICRDRAFT_29054 [Plicaturopsis crispa FD-325 SS-3]|nr:hypothetical protein PLICRDRAFT_29054 [Plicaturopsis crispa FD-325 SS-3]
MIYQYLPLSAFLLCSVPRLSTSSRSPSSVPPAFVADSDSDMLSSPSSLWVHDHPRTGTIQPRKYWKEGRKLYWYHPVSENASPVHQWYDGHYAGEAAGTSKEAHTLRLRMRDYGCGPGTASTGAGAVKASAGTATSGAGITNAGDVTPDEGAVSTPCTHERELHPCMACLSVAHIIPRVKSVAEVVGEADAMAPRRAFAAIRA